MQASYSIKHAVYQTGTTDENGYPIPDGYGAAVNRLVYGWYPQTSEIPVGNDELLQRVITNKIVMVPDTTPYHPGDRIAFPGDDINDDESAYRVSEDVRDLSTGPFPYKPSADAAAFGAIVVERVRG